LLNSAVDAGVRHVVFSSTCAVYGSPERIPITEQTPREPVNPYGASKLFLRTRLRLTTALMASAPRVSAISTLLEPMTAEKSANFTILKHT